MLRTMSYTLSDLKFIQPVTLRAWFREGKQHFAVVDVRDSDYIGGHIKGCWHYPSGNFTHTMRELEHRLEAEGITDVVVHCALSQVRGPKAALRLLRSIQDINDDSRPCFDRLNVWVLHGGFTRWAQHYGTDPTVTEGFVKDLWE